MIITVVIVIKLTTRARVPGNAPAPEMVRLEETQTTILSTGNYVPGLAIEENVEGIPVPLVPVPVFDAVENGDVLEVENNPSTSTPRHGLEFKDPVTFSPVKDSENSEGYQNNRILT